MKQATVMLESRAKANRFLKHIEFLAQKSSNRIVDGFRETEKELIKQFITDTRDLIDNGEWGIGLENLLNNIYEIEFTIDKTAINLAKDAIESCGLEYKDWTFIEELVK